MPILNLIKLLAASFIGLWSGMAVASDYPKKPVRLIVGYAAGGGADIAARVIAKELGEHYGQPFVVENRPGAANNIAVDSVIRAEPDGYTLLLSVVTSTINHSLYKNLNFDFTKDLAHIAKVSEGGFFLVVPPALPVSSAKELEAYLRQQPGKFAFSSSGVGTSIHVTGEMYKQAAGVDVIHVPYQGSAPALTDLIGGQVQYMFDNSALPHIQSEKLKALAVTSPQRSPLAPEVPTMEEAGYPGFQASWWYGISAPKGTPTHVVKQLNADIMDILRKDAVKQRLTQMGAIPEKHSPDEFSQFIANEVTRWGAVIKTAQVATQ